MKKVDKVLRELSRLYDFNKKLHRYKIKGESEKTSHQKEKDR